MPQSSTRIPPYVRYSCDACGKKGVLRGKRAESYWQAWDNLGLEVDDEEMAQGALSICRACIEEATADFRAQAQADKVAGRIGMVGFLEQEEDLQKWEILSWVPPVYNN